MKLIKITILAAIFFGVGVLTYFQMTEDSVEKAVSKEITEDEYERAGDTYELVEVPNSEYYLAIYNDPNQMLVMEVKDLFGGYKASVDAGMNLYQDSRKDSNHFFNDQLKYGTVELPEGKVATVDGEQLTTITIGDFFKDSKFYRDYKDLHFYYLKTPKETEVNAFETIVKVK